MIVGLTYAYFLTKINGNENTKSISVTTANLALVYGDGNGTITNEGNDITDYAVVIVGMEQKQIHMWLNKGVL